jgi:hypothetical protein
MQNHAYEHPYLQYRHLFFLFFLLSLFVAVLLSAPLGRALALWSGSRGTAVRPRAAVPVAGFGTRQGGLGRE